VATRRRNYRRHARFARRTPETGLPMNTDTIKNMIEQGLPGASANVHGPDGVHFEATVVAAVFAGKLPLARHRMVYATLGDLMGGEIHALSLKTLTPDEVSQARS
jgi:acid stress-induced BolA-like protein IbaG/YrbA